MKMSDQQLRKIIKEELILLEYPFNPPSQFYPVFIFIHQIQNDYGMQQEWDQPFPRYPSFF